MPPTNQASPAVLIVGAGPVGLVAAIDLARRDIAVRIIDAADAPTAEARAVVVHARSLEMLDALGVADEIIATGSRTVGLEFHADGATGTIDLTGVDSRYPFTISTPQTETERILRARLASLGVTVEYGAELTGLEQDAAGVHVRIARTSGGNETIDTPWVIGCDGAHSAVRHHIGEKLVGEFRGENFLMGDVEADYAVEHDRLHMYFTPNAGPEMLFPMVGRRARMIAQIEASEMNREPTVEWMQRETDERGVDVKIESAHWLTTFEIRHAQALNYRVGRVFIAGDAAHIHSPAGGQGMNTGMQDVFNLCWKLALVVDGSASDSLLDSYQAERHPIAEHVIKITTAITNVGTSKSPVLRAVRDFGFRHVSGLAPVQRLIANEVEEVRVSYRGSPIVAAGARGALRPGDAAPEVRGSSLWEQLHRDETKHVVLVFGSGSPTVPRGTRVVPVDDPDGQIAKRYGIGSRGGVVVIRPDGYIGTIAAGDGGAELDAYFARISNPKLEGDHASSRAPAKTS